jgi:hypothetical protein
MPVLWLDSVEGYGNNATIRRRYDCSAATGVIPSWSVGGRFNGAHGALRHQNNFGTTVRMHGKFSGAVASQVSSVVFGCYWHGEAGAGNFTIDAQMVMSVRDRSSAESNFHVGVGFIHNSNINSGAFCLMISANCAASTGDDNVLVRATGVGSGVDAEDYSLLEVSVVLDAGGTGNAVLYVCGVSVCSFTGITAASSSRFATDIVLHSRKPGVIDRFDDIYCFDASGDHNTAPVSTGMQILLYTPVGDSESDFTPSTGADNYAMVDDFQGRDDDTTHVSSNTAGNRDRYSVSGWRDTMSAAASPRALMINIGARSSGTAETLNLFVENNATEVSGPTSILCATATNHGNELWYMIDTDPDTASSLTASQISNITIGMEHV